MTKVFAVQTGILLCTTPSLTTIVCLARLLRRGGYQVLRWSILVPKGGHSWSQRWSFWLPRGGSQASQRVPRLPGEYPGFPERLPCPGVYLVYPAPGVYPAVPCPTLPCLYTLLHCQLAHVRPVVLCVHRPVCLRCRSGPLPALGPGPSGRLIYLSGKEESGPDCLPRGGLKRN